MAKREIAHYEQFLLLPQCFQKSSGADASKVVYKWERVKCFPHMPLKIYIGKNVKNKMIEINFLHKDWMKNMASSVLKLFFQFGQMT